MKISKLSLAFATCILSVAANASSIDNTSSKKGYSYVLTYDKDMSSISSSNAAMSLLEGYSALDDAIFSNSDNML